MSIHNIIGVAVAAAVGAVWYWFHADEDEAED